MLDRILDWLNNLSDLQYAAAVFLAALLSVLLVELVVVPMRGQPVDPLAALRYGTILGLVFSISFYIFNR